jgi:threonine dehydrogenase-like Zn-dependent dehydrogenase
MRAIVLEGDALRFAGDRVEPSPASGDVLVDVLCAGICETDLQLMRGYMGFRGVLGHEFVGVARAGRYAGQRVVGEINCACHECATCKAGLVTHCPHRTVIGILGRDGAFSDRLLVPEENLHVVPEEVSTEQAVFVEPVAAAFQILVQRPLQPGERVVVLGDGRLGNLCAQVLLGAGGRVTIVGKHARKLALLKELGIDTVDRAAARGDREADVVVDCTGSPAGLADALLWVRPRGTIVLKTTVAAEHALSLAAIVIDEITVVGSRCGPFAPAIQALAAGRVRVEQMIDAVVPLEKGVEALRGAAGGDRLKTLIRVG